jgi:hypothetical protein
MREVVIVGAGMLVGAAGGFCVGAWMGEKEDRGSDFPIGMAMFAFMGAGIGCAVGGLVGAALS